MATLGSLETEIVQCRACPRLVEWRERVGKEKRAAYRDETYWARPVPGFGDPAARLAVVGLAPGAHGANRTGRMFTGDRSGDWLFRAMHRAGFADRPESVSADDGLRLIDAWVTSPVKCVPPDNRPTAEERVRCGAFLEQELDLLARLEVIVCLGGVGFAAVMRHLAGRGHPVPKPRPKFRHGEVVDVGRFAVVASYHPSQQNTFTGRLTEDMLDAVFVQARRLID